MRVYGKNALLWNIQFLSKKQFVVVYIVFVESKKSLLIY